MYPGNPISRWPRSRPYLNGPDAITMYHARYRRTGQQVASTPPCIGRGAGEEAGEQPRDARRRFDQDRVPEAGQDLEPRAGDPCVQESRHARVRAEVALAGHDERGDPDPRGLVREVSRGEGVIGRRVGARGVLHVACRVSLEQCRVGAPEVVREPPGERVVEVLAGDAVLDDREPFQHALPLVLGAAGRRAEQREALDAVGSVEGQAEGNRGAQRVTRDMAAVDPEVVEQPPRVLGEERGRVRARWLRGLAAPAQVEADRREAAADRRHDAIPGVQSGAHAMDQEERRPGALDGVGRDESVALEPWHPLIIRAWPRRSSGRSAPCLGGGTHPVPVLEHRLGAGLVLLLAWLGWRARGAAGTTPHSVTRLPVILIGGSLAFLDHARQGLASCERLDMLIGVRGAIIAGLGPSPGWLELGVPLPSPVAGIWPGLIIVLGAFMAFWHRVLI